VAERALASVQDQAAGAPPAVGVARAAATLAANTRRGTSRVSPSSALVRTALVGSVLWAAASLAVGTAGLWLPSGADLGLAGVDARLLGLALAFAAGSFALRLARWYSLATRLAPTLSLARGLAFGTVGFALTATPGKAGEVFKLYLLRRHSGVPLAASAPILLVEKATEALGFLGVALLGGAFLAHALLEQARAQVWAPLGLGLVLALLVLGRQPVRRWGGPALARVAPWVARLPPLRDLARGSDRLLAPRPAAVALACSLGARLCDAVALYGVARAFSVDLALADAMAALGTAGLVGGFSFLPAGLGAVEATLAGLLAVLGHDLGRVLGVVLVARVLILWQWVALGLALALLRWREWGGDGRPANPDARPTRLARHPAALDTPAAPPAGARP
jgi:uncharacterized membrane protein YbhN (UPF0104 family)